MGRKRNLRPLLLPGETDIKGASAITRCTVDTLYTFRRTLPEDERPPLVRRGRFLVGRVDDLTEWAARRHGMETDEYAKAAA